LLAKKRAIETEKTHTTYKYYSDLIIDWANHTENSKLLVNHFEKKHAFQLFDWIESGREKRLSNRTFNNYRNFIFALFNELVKREYLIKNPIEIIQERTIQEAANFPFNEKQKGEILSHLLSTNQVQLYYFCKFIYYTLGRPTELIKLQRKHLFNGKIMFQGTKAKNKKTKYVPITKALADMLDEMKVLDTDPDSYIFGLNGIGSKKPKGENQFGQKHTEVLRALNYPSDYTMYSWKDTGACDLYIATKDIMYVKEMCRHSSVSQTEIYLRSMGMLIGEKKDGETPKLSI
jgi:integrase